MASSLVYDASAHLLPDLTVTDASMKDPLSPAEKMNGLRPERLGSHGTQAKKTSDVTRECESVNRAVEEHHQGDTSLASSAAGAPGAVTRVMSPNGTRTSDDNYHQAR